MTKKVLNQNAKYVQKLADIIEPDFFFNKTPINRFKIIKKNNENFNQNKFTQLMNLSSDKTTPSPWDRGAPTAPFYSTVQ